MTARGFDAGAVRAMSRRQFLASLARASGAALLLSSPLGCGTGLRGIERVRPGEKVPILNPVQREVVAKIIDGFYPPDTELRQRLATEDPSYDPVAAYADYAWASGDRFLGETKFLIDFLDVLPTFTWIFSTSRGLPAHLYLRSFSSDDANRYFLFLRDSGIPALRTIFNGAKFIATIPLYTNEKAVWKVISYPGPPAPAGSSSTVRSP
jgi:hypothetical protein